MHGGSVKVSSEGLGKGSEFVVTLPVVTLDRPIAQPNTELTMGSSDQRPKVLVVDDNRDAADSLQALFEMENCKVATAYDGIEAVQAVDETMPDMIIMDLGMPSMDGYEAARRIRRKPGSQDVLMIALTGWGQSDARQRTIEAGFDHHMIKPVNFEEIKRLVNGRFGRTPTLRRVV